MACKQYEFTNSYGLFKTSSVALTQQVRLEFHSDDPKVKVLIIDIHFPDYQNEPAVTITRKEKW